MDAEEAGCCEGGWEDYSGIKTDVREALEYIVHIADWDKTRIM